MRAVGLSVTSLFLSLFLSVVLTLVAGCTGDPIPVGGNQSVLAAHCENGIKDADETDVDCGGPSCLPCAPQPCDQGYGDCNGKPGDGCEDFVLADANNCGACGKPCAMGDICSMGICTPGMPVFCGGQECLLQAAYPECVMNTCQIKQCNPDYGDCDKNPKNGCEVDFRIDHFNCGSCGTVCPMGQACQMGACK